jgi:O-antigen/teichoic acid export membrane protein
MLYAPIHSTIQSFYHSVIQSMGIIKRQTIQSSVYTYAGVAVGFLTQGLFFPYLFSKAEIGLLTLLVSLSQVLTQASTLGLNSAGGRYFTYFRDTDRQHNGYLLISLFTMLAGFGLSVLGLWLARPLVIDYYGKASPLFVDYYYLLIPLTLFTLIFSVFDNYARLLYDPVTGTLLQQFVLRVLVLASGVCYWFGWLTFEQFLYVWLTAFLLAAMLMIAKVFRDDAFFLNRRFISVTAQLRTDIIRYSALSLATALSSQVILAIDKIMISNKLGLDDTGIYGTASYFAVVIAVPATALYKVSGALIADSWKTNNLDNIRMIYRKSCLNQLVAGCLVFVGVAANLPGVFRFLPAGYEAGYYVILWLGLGKLFDMATGVNGMILSTSRYYAYDSLFFIGLIFITIAVNLALIPQYGITGAAIGAALATGLFNLARTLFVGFAFRMQPFTWHNAAVIALGLVVWWVAVQIPYPAPTVPIWQTLLDMAWRSTLITGLFVGGIVGLNLSPDASSMAATIWQRIRRVR